MKKQFNSNNYSYFVLTGQGLEKINRGGSEHLREYIDKTGALGQGIGVTVRYVTSKDDKGRDKGKFFTWNESHRRFMTREGEKDINGISQYDFLKNAPMCEGSPNGNYTANGTQTGVVYREMNEVKDAEVALEADNTRVKAQFDALNLEDQTLTEVAAHIGVFAKPDDPENKLMRFRVADWAAKHPTDFVNTMNSGDRGIRALVRKAVNDGILQVQGSIHYWDGTMIGTNEDSTVQKVLEDSAIQKALQEKVQLHTVKKIKKK